MPSLEAWHLAICRSRAGNAARRCSVTLSGHLRAVEGRDDRPALIADVGDRDSVLAEEDTMGIAFRKDQ